VIEPGCSTEVDVNLICKKIGKVKIPMYIKIGGSDKPPLMIMMTGSCVGPSIETDKREVSWGKIACLKDHTRTLVMKNTSTIVAHLKCKIEGGSESKFRLDVRKHVLQPGESATLNLTVQLDDIVKFKEMLNIEVRHSDTIDIPLIAKGDGTTMFCREDLTMIDFGYNFTSQKCQRKFLLENKGRRSQVLKWINQTQRDLIMEERTMNKEKKKKSPKNSKKSPKRKKREPIGPPVFSVEPETIELKPRTACEFTFVGESEKAGDVEEVMICDSKMGKDQSTRTIFRSRCHVNFIDPLLEPSSTMLNFVHMYTSEVPVALQQQKLSFKNISELPLRFTLKTSIPFAVDTDEMQLEPGESKSVHVLFNPGYKNDRLSCRVDGKLRISYENHPQRDELNLVGEINFPNLDFEFTEINFGNVLNDTTKSMMMTVTNNSKIDCAYNWAFLEDEEEQRAVSTSRKPYIPVNEVFDILPIRSHLKPGETEQIEFVMYVFLFTLLVLHLFLSISFFYFPTLQNTHTHTHTHNTT